MELSANDNISTFPEIGTAFLTLRILISGKDYNTPFLLIKENFDIFSKSLACLTQYENFKTKTRSLMSQSFNSMVMKSIYLKQLLVIRAVHMS